VELPEGQVIVASEAFDARALPGDTAVWIRA
jgi:hypothetical protein